MSVNEMLSIENEELEGSEWETLSPLEKFAVKPEHRPGTAVHKMCSLLFSERGYSLLQHSRNYSHACQVKKPSERTGGILRYTRRLASGVNGIPQIRRDPKNPMRTRYRVIRPLNRKQEAA